MSLLPPELWHKIFREATYVPFILNTEWNYDPDEHVWDGCQLGEWTQSADVATTAVTKRSICLVCRTWRELGVDFLYESIEVPSEKDRIKMLLQAINASTPLSRTNGWWTKRIEIRPDIISPLLDELLFLLDSCPNLQIFIVRDDSGDDFGIHSLWGKQIRSRLPSSIRRVELPLYDSRCGHLESQDALPTFPLTTYSISATHTIPDLPLHTQFENISTLNIYLLSWDYVSVDSKQWYFPNLRSLALILSSSIGQDRLDSLTSFLKRHSDTLTYLHAEANQIVSLFHPLVRNVQTLTLSLDAFNRYIEVPDRQLRDADSVPAGNGPLKWHGITHIGLIMRGNDYGSCYCPRPDAVERVMEAAIFPDLKMVRLLRRAGKGDDWVKFEQRMQRHGVCVTGVARVLSDTEQR